MEEKIKGENIISMNELLLLSKEYISKDDFIKKIILKNYHFELCGNNDQLWLINNSNNKCELKIDLLLKDKNGNVIQDEFDYEIYEDSHVPYKGFLYSIEYNKISIMKKAIKQLKTLNRNLYIQYNGCGSFDSI